jgi:hypothetical protein
MHAGKQGSPGRRTGGTDVKIVEAHALFPQAVGVGSLEVGVPVGVDVSIALVVGENEDDVRFLGKCGPLPKRQSDKDREGYFVHIAKPISLWFRREGNNGEQIGLLIMV